MGACILNLLFFKTYFAKSNIHSVSRIGIFGILLEGPAHFQMKFIADISGRLVVVLVDNTVQQEESDK